MSLSHKESRTALDFVKERMFMLAKEDSKNVGGWEAVEDMARLKMSIDYEGYFILATAELLKTIPYPLESKTFKEEA
jgi:hypothetical protein